MKFLTIRQPWASLVALGVKTIETRGWSTSFRGPLAIHAGLHRPQHLSRVGEWYVLSQFTEPESGPELRRLGSVRAGELVPDRYELGLAAPMPLGAVVAVCDLVDVVPIANRTGIDRVSTETDFDRSPNLTRYKMIGPGRSTHEDITDQLPFGDFTPGRYAWILDNVRPIDPVPMKGAQGLRDLPEGVVIP